MSILLVTTPIGVNLTTLVAVKQEILIQTSDTSADDFLGQLIKEATQTIFGWAGRPLYRAQWLETVSGAAVEDLVLARYPIASVETVTIDGFAITDFTIDNASGMLHRTGGLGLQGWSASEWEILYTAGWLLDDDDLAGTYSVATTDDSYNDADSGFHPLLRAGDVVLGEDFANAGNNGLKIVASATTSKITVTSNLTTASAESASLELRNLPGWIERAAIDLVKLRYHARDRDPALSNLGIGSASASWNESARDPLKRIERSIRALSMAG